MWLAVYLVIGFVVAVVCAAIDNFNDGYDRVAMWFIIIGWPFVVLYSVMYGITCIVNWLGDSLYRVYRKVMKKWNA